MRLNRKISTLFIGAALVVSAIVGHSQSTAAAPPSEAQVVERFVPFLGPDGQLVRSADGKVILFDQLSAASTGPPLIKATPVEGGEANVEKMAPAFIPWRVVMGAKDQAEASLLLKRAGTNP